MALKSLLFWKTMATAQQEEMLAHIEATKQSGARSAKEIAVLAIVSLLISIIIATAFGRRVAKIFNRQLSRWTSFQMAIYRLI